MTEDNGVSEHDRLRMALFVSTQIAKTLMPPSGRGRKPMSRRQRVIARLRRLMA